MDRAPQRHHRASRGKRPHSTAGRWKGRPGGSEEGTDGSRWARSEEEGGEHRGQGWAGRRARQDESQWKGKEKQEEGLGKREGGEIGKGEKQKPVKE